MVASISFIPPTSPRLSPVAQTVMGVVPSRVAAVAKEPASRAPGACRDGDWLTRALCVLHPGEGATTAKAERELRAAFAALHSGDPRLARGLAQFNITDGVLREWLYSGKVPPSVSLVYELHRRAKAEVTEVSAELSFLVSRLIAYEGAVARARGARQGGDGVAVAKARQERFWAKESRFNAAYTERIFNDLCHSRAKLALAERALAEIDAKVSALEQQGPLADGAPLAALERQQALAKTARDRAAGVVSVQERAAREATRNMYDLYARKVESSTRRRAATRIFAGRYGAMAAVVEAKAHDAAEPSPLAVAPPITEAVRWSRRVSIVNPDWPQDAPTRDLQREAMEAARSALFSVHMGQRRAAPEDFDEEAIISTSRDYATAAFVLIEAYEAEADERAQHRQDVDRRLANVAHNASMLQIELGDVLLAAANARVYEELDRIRDLDLASRERGLKNLVAEHDRRILREESELSKMRERMQEMTSTACPLDAAGAAARVDIQFISLVHEINRREAALMLLQEQRDELAARLSPGAWPEREKAVLLRLLEVSSDARERDDLAARIEALEQEIQAELGADRDARESAARRRASRQVELTAAFEIMAEQHRLDPLAPVHGGNPGEPYVSAYRERKDAAIAWHERELTALSSASEDTYLEQLSARIVFRAALLAERTLEEAYEDGAMHLAGGPGTRRGVDAWNDAHDRLGGGGRADLASARFELHNDARWLTEYYEDFDDKNKAVYALSMVRAMHAYSVVHELKSYEDRASALTVLREARLALESSNLGDLDERQRAVFARLHGLAELDPGNKAHVEYFEIFVADDLRRIDSLQREAARVTFDHTVGGGGMAFGDREGLRALARALDDLAKDPGNEELRARGLAVAVDLSSNAGKLARRMCAELDEQEALAIAHADELITSNYEAIADRGGFVVGGFFAGLGRVFSENSDERHAEEKIRAHTDELRAALAEAFTNFGGLTTDEERFEYLLAIRNADASMLAQVCEISELEASRTLEAFGSTHTGELFIGSPKHQGLGMGEAARKGEELARRLPARTLAPVSVLLEEYSQAYASTVSYLERNWAAVQATDVVGLMLMGDVVHALGAGIATWAMSATELAKHGAGMFSATGRYAAAAMAAKGVLRVEQTFSAFQKGRKALAAPLAAWAGERGGLMGYGIRFAQELVYYRTFGVTLDAIRAGVDSALGQDSHGARLVHLIAMMAKLGPGKLDPLRIGISSAFEVGIARLYLAISQLPDEALAESGAGYLSQEEEDEVKRRAFWLHYCGRLMIDMTKVMVRRGQRILAGALPPHAQAKALSGALGAQGIAVPAAVVSSLAGAYRGYSFALTEVGHFHQPPSVFQSYRRSLIEALGDEATPRAQAAVREYIDDQLLVLAASRAGLNDVLTEQELPSAELLDDCIAKIANDALEMGLAVDKEAAEKLARQYVTEHVLLKAARR